MISDNLLVFFLVSLIPFSTDLWRRPYYTLRDRSIRDVFLLITLTFMMLQRVITGQPNLKAKDRAASKRNWNAIVSYGVAFPAAYVHSADSLVIIFFVAAYFLLNAFSRR